MRDRHPPEQLALRKFALSKGQIEGFWPLTRFSRLAPQLANCDGDVACAIVGEVDAVGRPFVHLTVKTQLNVVCQTCLQAMPIEVDNRFSLQLVLREDQIDEDADFDPIVVGDEEISLLSLVEDELILSLPVVANHEPDDCKIDAAVLIQHEQHTEVAEETPRNNPFAVLSSIKKTGKS
jgi:uncharacterized protein